MSGRRGDGAGTHSAALFGIPYRAVPPLAAGTPAQLFVVVDTEAEFDWSKPFARELTSVSAMDDVFRGQDVLDAQGIRPIYVVDYPIATQRRGYAPLRAILDRGACSIGAHLHPWTTPPFEEALLPHNSYPGNLDPALEARKLDSLVNAIAGNFGIRPVFYKAGRYGFGPGTAETLQRLGFRIDLSVLPGADLTRQGGPDFRGFGARFYAVGATGLMAVPMTRAEVGLFPKLAPIAASIQSRPAGQKLRLPSILAHLKLAETITLTPEGVTAAEQIRLIRALHARGCRQFVLHYHSPSLSPGHTPYAKDRTGAETVIARLRAVTRWFCGPFGGQPGNPEGLLARQSALREPVC